MSFTAKTYTCGSSGGVRKLVDLAGPWLDVSLPANGISGANGSILYDIEVDPNNGDKVYTVGEGVCSAQAFNWFGIAVSSNGGATWLVPGGNYQAVVNENCYHKWIEVSVVDANTIYVCGIIDPITRRGTVAKSIDGGLTFNMCALLPVTVSNQDCTSLHFITPLVGIVGLDNYVVKTTDGGATWTILNGGQPLSSNNPAPGTLLPIGPITGIYMSSDQTYIVGIGSDFIVEAIPTIFPTPAGLTVDSWRNNFYTNASGFNNNPLGYHLSYLKKNSLSPLDDLISITGYGELGIYTVDRGSSWDVTPPPGYQPSGTGFSRLAAHFYKSNPTAYNSQAGFYTKNGSIYANPTGFDPNVEVFSETSPYGINAIWTFYQELPDPPPCFRAIGCDGQVIVTTTDLSAFVTSGVYFSIAGYANCFFALPSADCVGAIAITLAGPTFSSCQECNTICFLLEDCTGVLLPIVTDNQLNTYVGQTITLSGSPGVCWQVSQAPNCTGKVTLTDTITAVFIDCITCSTICYKLTDCSNQFPDIITTTDVSQYIGQTIQLDTFPGVCWQVSNSNDCNGSRPLAATITSIFNDCVSCLKKCYKLTDCLGSAPDIITDFDLSLQVGKVITIPSQPNVCWLVTLSDTCDNATVIELNTTFDTCALCLALPPVIFVPLKTRSVQPGYGSEFCSIDYVEKINCAFADQVYAKLIKKKYGVDQCLEDTFDKYLIKKSILDLNLIYDPDACIVPIVPEACPVIPVVPPTPIPCMGPTEVTAEIVLEPVDCPAPTDVTATIVYQSSSQTSAPHPIP